MMMRFPQVIDPSCDAVPLFEYRRPTRDWLGACLFRLIDRGFDAVLLREGDTRRGTVLFMLAARDGACRHYTQIRLPGGRVVWARAGGCLDPVRSEVLTGTAIRRDPDLWICRIGGVDFGAWCEETEAPALAARVPAHGAEAVA
jgi:hypothetical protein